MAKFTWTLGTPEGWTDSAYGNGDDSLSYPAAGWGSLQDLSFQTFGIPDLSLPVNQVASSQTITTAFTVVDTGAAWVAASGVPTITPLASFNFPTADGPRAGVIADSAGNLFGTCTAGTSSEGRVFEVPYVNGSYASTPTVLASLSYPNQHDYSIAGLVADADGDLFGTTPAGGTNSDGTVFELPFINGSYASTPATLISFDGKNGSVPGAALIIDGDRNLFGTAGGVAFEVPFINGSYASTPTVLASIGGGSLGALMADKAGNLFGTTAQGGGGGYGSVFEIPFLNGSYASTATTLASFNGFGTNGKLPEGGVIADDAGNLFGTTSQGGANGQGTVYEVPFLNGSYASTPTTLISFEFAEGQAPAASLIMDAAGNLFGTAGAGGMYNGGTVFEVPRVNGSYASTPTVLVSARGDIGGGLIVDNAGDFFGTTLLGGADDAGTVFELSGSGFVTCYLRGTRIATPNGERAIESLAVGDLVLTASSEVYPIVWIGQRHISCRRHPRPENIWPVRVCAGAFDDRMPRRDLWLSPDHAVFVEDVLIPIKYLINGNTIERVPKDEVIYFHIELPHHDVLLAEDLPAESYLDTGDRVNFDNCGFPAAIHPNFGALRWESAGCAPLIIAGPELNAARRGVLAQAAKMSRQDAAA